MNLIDDYFISKNIIFTAPTQLQQMALLPNPPHPNHASHPPTENQCQQYLSHYLPDLEKAVSRPQAEN